MKSALSAGIIAGAMVALPALANEWDDAISKLLVVPAKLYEYKEAKWRECLTAHPAEERLAAMSRLVVTQRELVATTRTQVDQYARHRTQGQAVDAVVEIPGPCGPPPPRPKY